MGMSSTSPQARRTQEAGRIDVSTNSGHIPEDWPLVPLAAVCSFANGVNADKEAYGKGVRFINVLEIITSSHLRAADIPGRVRLSKVAIEAFAVRRGDIVFNRTSETQEEVGLSAVYDDNEKLVFGGFVIRGRFTSDVFDLTYAGYAFRAPIVRSQIIAQGQGAIRANIGQANLRRVLVPIPSKSEQRAIAEALSDADGKLRALESLIAKKRVVKQAAMQQLLTGKTRLPGFSGAWGVEQIDDLALLDAENLSSSTDPDFRFNYISLEQVDRGRLLSFSEEIFRTAPSRARRVLRHDDVLMSTVRPNLMAHLHYKSQVPKAVCSTGFAVLRARPKRADAGFIFAHLFGHVVNTRIEMILAGSNYPAISSRDVRMIELPCPPTVAEQSAIANVLSDMDAEIAALEARRDKTHVIKQGMMQQLLTGRIRLVEPQGAA